jgi:limonene-1,2-epoxide hydrolase
MNQHEQLIEKFYTAFQQKDWQTMQSCYHAEVTFSDPAFQNVKGKEAKAMWHLLTISAKDFSLHFSQVKADDKKGSCQWQAAYAFSRTGRKVINQINASFEFKEGLIFRHTDRFDFWKWTRMALGTPGVVLGWSSFLQNKVRATARGGLTKFMAENALYQ